MTDEEPTLKNIAKEFTTPGYWERARKRQRASKTAWDLLFMPLGFGAMFAYWYGFCRLFVGLHLLVYPADRPRIDALTGGPMTLAQGLMFLVPLFAALPLGMMTGNVLQWLTPPARRAAEKKAGGVKWAGIREAQKSLFSIALVLVPIGLASGIIGALILGR